MNDDKINFLLIGNIKRLNPTAFVGGLGATSLGEYKISLIKIDG
jgi:hypothetical protein